MSEAEKYSSNPGAGPVIHSASGSLAERLQTEKSKQIQDAKVKRFLAEEAAKKSKGGRRTRRRGARKSRRGKGKGKSRRRRRSKKCKCSLL